MYNRGSGFTMTAVLYCGPGKILKKKKIVISIKKSSLKYYLKLKLKTIFFLQKNN